jgi:hypothetical protein
MTFPQKDRRLIRKEYTVKTEKDPERIRLGNGFVDEFIFGDQEAADIPISALRVIFNIIAAIGSEQFRPEDRPHQLSLFNEEFETDHNVFAAMKIKNHKISPSGSSRQVIEAYEFLTRFRMGWYRSLNLQGKEIRTFGGLISTPSHEHRGDTSFLISSYWLKKLVVIPEYNYVLYDLVYTIRNNKHIIFAIWLSKVPPTGTVLKLSTLNRKFGLNYRTANDLCFKFLKPARSNLDRYNNLSFHFKYKGEMISIIPYPTDGVQHIQMTGDSPQVNVTRRLRYFRKRYGLREDEMLQLSYQYKNITQTRELIEKAFSEFIRTARSKGKSSTESQGRVFLMEIQEHMIKLYRETKIGKVLPNGYPVIL